MRLPAIAKNPQNAHDHPLASSGVALPDNTWSKPSSTAGYMVGSVHRYDVGWCTSSGAKLKKQDGGPKRRHIA